MAAPGPQPRDIDYEAKLAEFDKIPLFMKSLPEEDTEDATIAALQDLAYEGTPDSTPWAFCRCWDNVSLRCFQIVRKIDDEFVESGCCHPSGYLFQKCRILHLYSLRPP